ncbi:glucagon receptor isoform X2 [Amblyraja radiata]|uniref:glucagon receptor isoform X2 n=1 Tax=Amblyraja radiata TaxID=386614 RepID=UPI001402A9FF|nr:glucagon receptor isoform X2 [Amblyraja radiata]
MVQPRLLTLLIALSANVQRASAVVLENTLEKWQRYYDDCIRNITRDPQPKGVVCNRTFDKYACWPDALPNTTANVSCPWYLPWYHAVQGGSVFRRCGLDGEWLTDSVKQPWRDSSQCENDPNDDQAQEHGRILDGFIVMYTVGFSLSLATLVLALGILVGFRKLHCMRNYIHMNLFASFILRAMSILVKDALFKTQFPEAVNIEVWFNNETAAGCRTAQVLMQYCIGANYYWLLIEGIYLHNLLVVTVFSEMSYFNTYLCIGWGSPLLFVVPWIVVKYLYENTGCWMTNENMAYWWIIRTPILLSILINFFIFIRIIHILVSKLRAHQMGYTDYKLRLAKSTLTLIPLLGIHEVVFAFVTDEQARGTLRHVKLFFELFLNSFQGMLVAILYCFIHREVQCELLKRWRRWKLGKVLEEQYRHMCSIPPAASAALPPCSGSLAEQRLVRGGRDGPNGCAHPWPGPGPDTASVPLRCLLLSRDPGQGALCQMESNC